MELKLTELLEDLFRSTPAPLPDNQCAICHQKYKTYSALKNHVAQKHPDIDISMASTGSDTPDDKLATYSRELIKMLLLKRHLDRAVKAGDGDRVLLSVKFMYFYFIALGHKKYALACFEMLCQQELFLSDKMKTLILHERFVNNSGRANGNVPMDMDLEFCNRQFKEEFNVIQGDASDTYLNRISKAVDKSSRVLDNFAKEFCQPAFQARRKVDDDKYIGDVMKLVGSICEAKVFTYVSGRRMYSEKLNDKARNPLALVDMFSVKAWMVNRVREMKCQTYYMY